MPQPLLPLALLLFAACLAGCSGVEQATENPPPRGEHFSAMASPGDKHP